VTRKCPRCIGGNTFIDFVEGQWREYCLQCGYSRPVSESDPRIPKDPKIRSACEVGKGIRPDYTTRKNLPVVMPRRKGARNIVAKGLGFKLNGDK
jgi:ribosomal protein S27AE